MTSWLWCMLPSMITLLTVVMANVTVNVTSDMKQTSTENSTDLLIGKECHPSDQTLLELYKDMQVPTKQLFLWNCDTLFVEVCKQNNSNEMLLFTSIFKNGPNGTTIRADFESLTRALLPDPSVLPQEIPCNLVIRFDQFYPNDTNSFSIKVDDASYFFELDNNNFGVSEYLIPQGLMYDKSNGPPEVTVSFDQSEFYINTSYVMLCVSSDDPNLNCTLAIEGLQVECYCERNASNGIVPVAIEMVALWAILLVVLLYYNIYCTGPSNPEVQINMILCMVGQSTHEYLAIFRVGPANEDFDFESTYIDIQLLTTGDETVGIPVRFQACHLPDHLCAEMHMLICRMAPLPQITAVRVNHSGNSGKLLYLHDFTLVNLRQNIVLQEETVKQFITSESNIFRPLKGPQAQLSQEKSNQQKQAWCMLLSISNLTMMETIAFCFLMVGLVALATMMARVNLHCYEHWKNMARSMGQFFASMAISLLALVIVTALEVFFVRYIKRNYLLECHLQVTSDSKMFLFWLTRMFFLGVIAAVGVGLAIFTIVYSKKLDLIGAMFWSGLNLSTVSVALGLWLLVNEYILVYMKSSLAKKDLLKVLVESGLLPMNELKTINSCSGVMMPLSTSAVTLPSIISNYGPKMSNPNWVGKSKVSNYSSKVESYRRFLETRSIQSGHKQTVAGSKSSIIKNNSRA